MGSLNLVCMIIREKYLLLLLRTFVNLQRGFNGESTFETEIGGLLITIDSIGPC